MFLLKKKFQQEKCKKKKKIYEKLLSNKYETCSFYCNEKKVFIFYFFNCAMKIAFDANRALK